jgi:adenosine deaminase CECR1
MPKGALLHCHLDATVNAEFLLELALKHPFMHVRVEQPLTAANLSSTLPQFRALPDDQFAEHPSLTSASYELGSWVSLQNARNSFASELGGVEGFDKWVIGSLTVNPTEAYDTHNTVEKVRVK